MRGSKRVESLGKGYLICSDGQNCTSRHKSNPGGPSCRIVSSKTRLWRFSLVRGDVDFGCDAGHARKYSNAIGPGRVGVKGCGLRSE